MIYAKQSRKNADGTVSVVLTSTITPSELRERGITPGPKESLAEQSGICIVCGGRLTEKVRYEDALRGPFLAVEPREPVVAVQDGYFCVQCGLRYEFVADSQRRQMLTKE